MKGDDIATVHRSHRRAEVGPWVRHGAYGGIIAGLVFALVEMVAAAALSGPATVFMPLRMIGGILLGAEALDPAFPLLNAVLAGGLVHLALSAVFGVVGGALLGAAAPIRRSSNWAIGLATVYGYLLWLVNFFVLAYIAGWTWFPEDTNPIVQFLAHTVGFGTVLGVYLASRLVDPSREND